MKSSDGVSMTYIGGGVQHHARNDTTRTHTQKKKIVKTIYEYVIDNSNTSRTSAMKPGKEEFVIYRALYLRVIACRINTVHIKNIDRVFVNKDQKTNSRGDAKHVIRVKFKYKKINALTKIAYVKFRLIMLLNTN